MIWNQTAYDCVENLKMKMDYDREMSGQDKIWRAGIDLKSEIVSLSDRDGCEMGVEETYEVDET